MFNIKNIEYFGITSNNEYFIYLILRILYMYNGEVKIYSYIIFFLQTILTFYTTFFVSINILYLSSVLSPH